MYRRLVLRSREIFVVGTFLLPVFVSAQLNAPKPIESVGQLQSGLFCTIINVIYTGALILSVIFVLYAAFQYITAGGDPDKVHTANRTILYAAVGVAVAILSKSVPLIVGALLGVGEGQLKACP